MNYGRNLTRAKIAVLLRTITGLELIIKVMVQLYSKFDSLMYSMQQIYKIHDIPLEVSEHYSLKKIEVAQIAKSSNQPLVHFQDVKIRYFEPVSNIGESSIVENLNFQIEKGEKICIVGKSGSGKSTIFKALNGYFSNFEGEIILHSSQ